MPVQLVLWSAACPCTDSLEAVLNSTMACELGMAYLPQHGQTHCRVEHRSGQTDVFMNTLEVMMLKI